MKNICSMALISGKNSRGSYSDGNGHLPATKGAVRLEVPVSLTRFIPGSIDDVFNFIAAQDVLPKILTGYGLVPGVASTSGLSGPWDRPGSMRTVHLLDGSTVRESITHHQPPDYFAYRVSDPSFSLKHLMTQARGQWWFVAVEGGTQATWIYTFTANNALAKLPLRLFVSTQWKGYMTSCLNKVVGHFLTV